MQAYQCDECNKLLSADAALLAHFLEFKVKDYTVAVTCCKNGAAGEFCSPCMIGFLKDVIKQLKKRNGNGDGTT